MKRTLSLFVLFTLPALMLAAFVRLPSGLQNPQYKMFGDRGYRISETITYDYWDSDWHPNQKFEFVYDANHPDQFDAVYSMLWDEETGSYQPFLTLDYEYNTAGRIVSTLGFMEIPEVGPINYVSMASSYDSQHRITHFLMSVLNFMTMTSEPSVEIRITYSGNTLSEMVAWESLSSRETPYSRQTFDWDNNGRPISAYEEVSVDSISWTDYSVTTTTYHPHDTSNHNTFIEFFSATLPKAYLSGTTFTPGMPVEEITQLWSGGNLVNDERETYSWDASVDKLQSIVWDYWDGSAWQAQDRELYAYDTNLNVSEITYQYLQSDWENDTKDVYSWESTTSIDDPATPAPIALSIKTYPQPFLEDITILPSSKNTGDIELGIYNLKGQLVQSQSLRPDQAMVWDGKDANGRACSPGVYFVKASQGRSSVSSKIVKLK